MGPRQAAHRRQTAFADQPETPDATAIGTSGSAHRFGVELSLLSPVAQIWAARATYSAWRYGDVIAGYAYQNERLDDVGRASAHTGIVGYRQFLIRGLYAEVDVGGAEDPIRSYVDGRTYDGFDVWGEFWLGYRFDVRLREADGELERLS